MRGDDFLVETWHKMKPFISKKDRQDAADALVSVLDEFGYVDGHIYEDIDRELKIALETLYGPSDYDDDEDELGW